MARILVTGAAGFIGFHTARRLLADGHEVLGIDNLSEYYDVDLKKARLAQLEASRSFTFHLIDLSDREAVEDLFERRAPDRVIHLAAQAGVRYSLTNPHAYVDANVTGFLHVLEGCRHVGVDHLVYASTSSAYGANTRMPFREGQSANHPLTLYAATKRANELMAHSYSHLFGIPTTGLRFFTVYGPWGRPDMALFLFTRAILAGEPIPVFNGGDMMRDFTYVDDVVEGVVRVAGRPAIPSGAWDGDEPDPSSSGAPWRIFNIGNGSPTPLMRYIEVLEECLGRKAQCDFLPMQPGDVPGTWADTSALAEAVGFKPCTTVDEGIRKFVAWYCDYYGVSTK